MAFVFALPLLIVCAVAGIVGYYAAGRAHAEKRASQSSPEEPNP